MNCTGGAAVKTIMKIEIAILILVVLVAVGMILVSEGVLELFHEPVIAEPGIARIPTEAPAEVTSPTEAPAAAEESTAGSPARELTAAKYFAYDIRKGEYLQKQGEGDAKLYPASITKLLTCYTLLQHMDPDTEVTVGDAMNLVQWDSSVADLKEGDVLTVEELMAAMLLPSGNDAAQVAAVAAGRKIGGSNLPYDEAVSVFVKEMNRQAQLLGMENSHFANPDGFHHANHYTTMDDLVRLCQVVLTEPAILRYTGMPVGQVTLEDRTLEWMNTNYLLHDDAALYLPNTIGLKTGYTEKAGNCLISAFFMEDRILLIGVFGCPAFSEDRYLDTIAIYNSL